MRFDKIISKARYLVDAYKEDDADIDLIMENEKTLPYDVLALCDRKETYDDIAVADVTREDYDEAHALQNLLVAIEDAQADEFNRSGGNPHDIGGFTINIAGKSIAFYIGGPQCEALYAFIKHICEENLYELSITTNTVKGWNDK